VTPWACQVAMSSPRGDRLKVGLEASRQTAQGGDHE
jgi:hypothetical protein